MMASRAAELLVSAVVARSQLRMHLRRVAREGDEAFREHVRAALLCEARRLIALLGDATPSALDVTPADRLLAQVNVLGLRAYWLGRTELLPLAAYPIWTKVKAALASM